MTIKRFQLLFFTITPFIIFGVFQFISAAYMTKWPHTLRTGASICLAVLLLIIALQVALRDTHYFPGAVTMFFVVWTILLYSTPVGSYGHIIEEGGPAAFMLKHPQFGLYGALFLMALAPPLFGRPPFTCYFAAGMAPEAFHRSRLYLRVNLVITYFWALLFGLCAATQFLPGMVLQSALPFVLQLAVGVPATRFMVPFLQRKLAFVEHQTTRPYLVRAYDAVMGMPFIFDEKASAGVNTVFQFRIHGDEEFSAFLTVKDGTCVFSDGEAAHPDCIITSPADVWLRIARGELDGAAAFLKRMYTAEGDLSCLIKLQEIFQGSAERTSENSGLYAAVNRRASDGHHVSVDPGSIKKVLVIQGSPRGKGVSNTDILAGEFLMGCEDAGAETETVYLKDKNIRHCTGCFSCWTRTPGSCVHDDDAADVMRMADAADLVVYAFPLYHFGINALMKKYIERTLPMLEPFLVPSGDGSTCHPIRETRKKKRYAVFISVCGFPELSHFEPLSAQIRALGSSGEAGGMGVVAEIYRPASETLGIPFYKKERRRVLGLAREAGRQVVTAGKIDSPVVDAIARVEIPVSQMRKEANLTWELCIREGKTLPQLQKEMSTVRSDQTDIT